MNLRPVVIFRRSLSVGYIRHNEAPFSDLVGRHHELSSPDC